MTNDKFKRRLLLTGLLVLVVVLCLSSLSVGRYPLPISDIIGFVFDKKQ